MEDKSYIIAGGQRGSDRLKLMARVTWDISDYFLRSAGLRPGNRVLELACGNAEVTRRYFDQIMERNGEILGVDFDEPKIKDAKELFKDETGKVIFEVSNVEQDDLSRYGKFDFIYCRLIFSHLRSPRALMDKLKMLLSDEGILAIEDVDFDGHVAYPENKAFNRYVEAYKELGKARGADPLIGRKLPSMLRSSGYDVQLIDCRCPAFLDGEGKHMVDVSFDLIGEGLVSNGIMSKDEHSEVHGKIVDFANDPTTLISLPKIFQVSAKKK